MVTRFLPWLLLLAWIPSTQAASTETQPPVPLPQTLIIDGSFVHDVGNLHMNITNFGLIGSTPGVSAPYSDAPSAEWPAGSGVEYLWAAGLWIGAMKNGEASVSTGQYTTELLATDDPLDIIYRQIPDQPGGSRYPHPPGNDDFDDEEDEDPRNALDDDGDGLIDEDYGVIGDQHFYTVMRDNTALASQISPNHRPLDIEVIQESFQWASNPIDDFVGMRITVRNLGVVDLSDVYVGVWVDSDVGPRGQTGNASDDSIGYVDETVVARDGSLVPLRLPYMFDADGDGGQSPGYFGVLLLGHPTDPTGITAPQRLGPTSIQGYQSVGGPTNDLERYAAMSAESVNIASGGVADFRYLVSVGPFDLLAGRWLFVDLAFVIGEGLEGLVENATEAALVYYGQHFDRDDDPETGTRGRDYEICASDFGPPGPTNPIFDLFATCVDSADFAGPDPPQPISEDDLDANGCTLIDSDCTLELIRRGEYDCDLDGEVDPDDLAGCTGVGGREFGVPWYASPTVVPAVVGTLTGQAIDGVVYLEGEARLPMDAPLFLERASSSERARRWEQDELGVIPFGPGRVGFNLHDTDDAPWPRDYRLGYRQGSQDVVLAMAKVLQGPLGQLVLDASPNPFNPNVVLRYQLPRDGVVRVSIVDARGRQVRSLVDRFETAGPGSSLWDGRDGNGQSVASGVYVVRIELEQEVVTRRLALVR